MDLYQLGEHFVPADVVAFLEKDHLPQIFLRGAEPIDTRHRRDDDHVVAHEQAGGGGVAEPIDLLVDGGVLFDVGVARGQVRLGLVVVVIRDEVLDGALGQELAELVAQLSGESLVGGHDQRRFARLGDEVGHREGLARAGHPEQRLEPVSPT